MPYDINGKPLDKTENKPKTTITFDEMAGFIVCLSMLLSICAVPMLLILVVRGFVDNI